MVTGGGARRPYTRFAVRALVVASRFPWPPVTGDRLRTTLWLEALAGDDVTLVAPPGTAPAGVPRFTHLPARRSPGQLVVAVARVLARGLPATALLAAGRDWSGALAGAGAPFDVAVVVLARTDPWVFPHLRARRTVLDAIDSLAANLGERARHARGVASRLWRLESARTAHLEADAARRYDRVVVVAGSEAEVFGKLASVVPIGVELRPASEGEREFDVGFTGRLAYFANRDAAGWLLDEIWPRVRAAAPKATLLLAGADAPLSIRRRHGRDGVTVISPVADPAALLRRVRVALLPLRFGTGQSLKAIEAAEASCALVATAAGVRGLPALLPHALSAGDAERLAAAVIGLLGDEPRRAALGAAARAAVGRAYPRGATLAGLAAIAGGGD
jgi:glycosyltransferase involved in cell wall biosynthesis